MRGPGTPTGGRRRASQMSVPAQASARAGISHDGDKDPKYTLIFDPIQHLNAAGYEVVVSHLVPEVESMLAKQQAADQDPIGHLLSVPLPPERPQRATQ